MGYSCGAQVGLSGRAVEAGVRLAVSVEVPGGRGLPGLGPGGQAGREETRVKSPPTTLLQRGAAGTDPVADCQSPSLKLTPVDTCSLCKYVASGLFAISRSFLSIFTQTARLGAVVSCAVPGQASQVDSVLQTLAHSLHCPPASFFSTCCLHLTLFYLFIWRAARGGPRDVSGVSSDVSVFSVASSVPRPDGHPACPYVLVEERRSHTEVIPCGICLSLTYFTECDHLWVRPRPSHLTYQTAAASAPAPVPSVIFSKGGGSSVAILEQVCEYPGKGCK
nr:uncharacterized protein LOC116157658 [Camelus dromedarius]